MKFRLGLAALCVALVGGLSACGGGGAFSSVGGPIPKPPAGNQPEAAPSITLSLQTADGASTTSVALGGVSARALLLDALGQPVANRLVTFSTDAQQAVLTPDSGQVLTNAQGIAIVQIAPATLQSSGASQLTVMSSVDQKSVTASLDFQITASNLQLKSLDLGAGPLQAYGNRPVSVTVTANGQPVRDAVPVNFTTNCGVLSPATANTDGKGVASTTFSATLPSCFGSKVSISAAIAGLAPLSGSIDVQAAEATNIQFVSSSPSTIYLASATGPTQALVTFKVVDNTGAAVANRKISLSLSNVQAGVSLDSQRNTSPVSKTSDAQGLVSVSVFAGVLPTSVVVIASADGIPPTSSNVLTVASGRAVQRSASISVGAFVIEGYDHDGAETSVTMSVADRLGNPVPDGTAINFVSEGGVMLPATCVTANGTSSCSSRIRSQGNRQGLGFGRVSILAYLAGEEDFVDANGNNIYDAGEPFTDMGAPFNDWDENGVFTGNEFTLPRATGTCTALIPGAEAPDNVVGGDHSRPDTCDGAWGVADIRRQAVVTFATSEASIYNWVDGGTLTLSLGSPVAGVRDLLGNSMPVGTTISVSSKTDGCTASSTITRVPNIAFPLSAVQAPSTQQGPRAETAVPIDLKNCNAGAQVTVQARSPGGVATERTFILQ